MGDGALRPGGAVAGVVCVASTRSAFERHRASRFRAADDWRGAGVQRQRARAVGDVRGGRSACGAVKPVVIQEPCCHPERAPLSSRASEASRGICTFPNDRDMRSPASLIVHCFPASTRKQRSAAQVSASGHSNPRGCGGPADVIATPPEKPVCRNRELSSLSLLPGRTLIQ